MRRCLFALVLAGLPTGAQAEECGRLGLESAYLARYFCDLLTDIAKDPGPGRGVLGEPDGAGAPGLPRWADIELIQDAYRADPRKTLELIKRIKGAGGLADQ